MSLQPSRQLRLQKGRKPIPLTDFILYKVTYFFSMMNSTVVENEDTTWSRIKVGERNLHIHDFSNLGMATWLQQTTSSFRNCKKCPKVTEPSIMS